MNGYRGTPSRTCTVTLREDSFLILPLPSPALLWALHQLDGGKKSVLNIPAQGGPFGKPSRDHMLWHKISGATCPHPPGSSGMGWMSPCRGLGLPSAHCSLFSCPFFGCPWVTERKQTRGSLGERIPRDQTVACLFLNLSKVVIQKVDTKEKRNQNRKHCGQDSSEGRCVSKL